MWQESHKEATKVVEQKWIDNKQTWLSTTFLKSLSPICCWYSVLNMSSTNGEELSQQNCNGGQITNGGGLQLFKNLLSKLFEAHTCSNIYVYLSKKVKYKENFNWELIFMSHSKTIEWE